MQDRVPLYPGRVVLTPVSGQANTYDMTRADQPTQEGTPLNKASLLKDATAALFGLGADAVPDQVLSAIRGPGAVTKTYPVASESSILQGDVVDVVNGEVQKTITAVAPKAVSKDGPFSIGYAASTTDGTIVAGYVNNPGSTYTYGLCILDETLSVVESKAFSFYSGLAGLSANRLVIKPLSNNRVAIVYNQSNKGYIVIATVSNESITFSSILQYASYANGTPDRQDITELDGNKLFLIQSTGHTALTFFVIDFTSSALSILSQNQKNGFTNSSCDYAGNNVVYVVLYTSTQNSFLTATISSNGSSITLSSSSDISIQVSIGNITNICALEDNRCLCIGQYGYCILSISGSTQTTESYKFLSNQYGLGLVYKHPTIPDYYIVPFSNSGYRVLSLQISTSSVVDYLSSKTTNVSGLISVIMDSASVYILGTNSSTNVYTVAEFTIPASLEIDGYDQNGSTEAIALNSGTSGNDVEIVYSGTVFVNWVTEGQKISSDGVQGIGILPGVLQVLGKNSPGVKIITGSYAGTGGSGAGSQNIIEFESTPKVIFISAKSSSSVGAGIIIPGGIDSFSEQPKGLSIISGSQISTLIVTSNAGTIKWYYTNSNSQLNESGIEYVYFAIL